ncbi:MAG: response regulator transcription factor [Flavobacteriales bacterium]|nr:response regulator transcription factor [Flavobacteriales bacterium]
MIKTAILDDNPKEVERLISWLENHPNVQYLGDYSSALEIQKVTKDVELLFCDIEMPEVSGFDFIRTLKHKPQIAFISSHGNYALDSFEFEPIHFIQKPIEQSRVLEAIERARLNIDLGNCLKDFIFVKTGTSDFIKVDFGNILFLNSMDDFVQIHLENSRITTYTRLKDIKKRLPKTFIQTHRSFIVNVKQIHSVNTKDLELHNGMEIPISGSYRNDVKKLVLES